MPVGAISRLGSSLVVYTGTVGGLVCKFREAAHDFGVCSGDYGIGGRGG